MAANEGERIKKIADETQVVVEDALRSIASNIGDIFAQALSNGQNASKTLAKDVTGTINSLAKSTDVLVKNQEKANKGILTYKDITAEIQSRNARIQTIKNQIEIAERNGVGNAKQLKKELASIESYNKEVENSLQSQLKYSKDISKTMGLTGAAIGGISKLASKMGFEKMSDALEEAHDRAAEMAKKIVDSKGHAGGLGAKFKILGSTVGFLGKALLKNLLDPLVLIKGAVGLVKGAFGLLKKGWGWFKEQAKESVEAYKQLGTQVSSEIQGIARGLGLAQGAASKLYGQVAGLGPTAGASATAIEGIYSAMGSTEELSKKTLDRFVKLNIYAGYSAESLASMQKYAKILGQDAGTVVDEFNQQIAAQIKSENLAIGQKQAFEAVSKVSNNIRGALGGSVSAITKAVLSSKKLGLELEDALDSAKGFLNLEESISSEQELRLLTGKDIDLTKAREMAATRDFVGLNKEIARITKDIGGDAQNNQFVMDALVKTLGINEDKVANILNAGKEQVKVGKDLNKENENAKLYAQGRATMGEAEENRERALLAIKGKQGAAFKSFYDYIEKATAEAKEKIFAVFGENFKAWWNNPETKTMVESLKESLFGLLDRMGSKDGVLNKVFNYVFNPQTGIINRGLRDMVGILNGDQLTSPQSFIGKAFNFIKELKNSETFQALRDGMEAGRKAVWGIFKAFDNLLKIPGMKTLLSTFIAGAAATKLFKFALNATGIGSLFKKDGSTAASALYVQVIGGGMAGPVPSTATALASTAVASTMTPTTGMNKAQKAQHYQDYKKSQQGKGLSNKQIRAQYQTQQRQLKIKPTVPPKQNIPPGRPGRLGLGNKLMAGMMIYSMASSMFGGGEEEAPVENQTKQVEKQLSEKEIAAKERAARQKRMQAAYEKNVGKDLTSAASQQAKITVNGKTYTGKNLDEATAKAEAAIASQKLGDKKSKKESNAIVDAALKKNKQEKETAKGPSYSEWMGGQKPGEGLKENLSAQLANVPSMMAMNAITSSDTFTKTKEVGKALSQTKAGQKVGQTVSKASSAIKNTKAAKTVQSTLSKGKNILSKGKNIPKAAGFFGSIGNMFSGGWDKVKKAGSWIGDKASSAKNWVGDKAGQAWDWTKKTAGKVGKFAKNSIWWSIEQIGGKGLVQKLQGLLSGGGGGLLKSVIKGAGGWVKKLFKNLLKMPVISGAIDALFAVGDINQAVKAGVSGKDLQKLVGQKALGTLGGVVGGVGMEFLVNAILQGVGSLIPGLGNTLMGWIGTLISPFVYSLGSSLGKSLFEWGGDALGGDVPLGKMIMSLGWPKEKSKPKNSKMKVGNDIMSRPGYGDRVLLAPEGAIALNNKDTVIAGTKLFGDDVISSPKGSVGLGTAELVAELRAIRLLLSKENGVYLDGSKVGVALTKGAYKLK